MRQYTVHHHDRREGPMTGEALLARYRSGEFPATALTWRPGLAGWGELAAVLRDDGLLPPEASGANPPALTRFAAPISATEAPPCPDNWLGPAIATTLCCCVPFGIAGIVYAAQVKDKHAAGDYAGAENAAANAKKYTLLAIGLGFLAALVHLLVGPGL